MGGYGSGPYGHMGSKIGKLATNQCIALDIRRLKRQDGLKPGIVYSVSWPKGESIGIKTISAHEIELNYTTTIDHKSEKIKQLVPLTFSACNYGNERAWFECPDCGERVALLYLKGFYFRCRRCHGLTYYSCQESGNLNDMSMRRVNRVLARLKSKERCCFDIVYYTPPRPRYMHRKTYRRLMRRYLYKRNEYAASVRAKLESFGVTGPELADAPDYF